MRKCKDCIGGISCDALYPGCLEDKPAPIPCEGCTTPSLCRDMGMCPRRDHVTMDEVRGAAATTVITDEVAKDTNPKSRAAQDKVSVSLVPEVAILELAQAFRDGGQKYGPFNWRDDPVAASIYIDAAYRHMLRWQAGEDIDPDSGLSHLTHAMSNFAILIDAEFNDALIDDRKTTAGKGADVNARIEEIKERNRNARG